MGGATTEILRNGHTIDWGDVSIDEADQKAVYLQKDSRLVVGIYTNAIHVLAMRSYIQLLSKNVPINNDEIRIWKRRLTLLQRSIISILWKPRKGYFIMHKHVTTITHVFDEDAMFAMGGNAVAIEAGVANADIADKIIKKAFLMKKRFNAATISGVLYPPYPNGVYKHPEVTCTFEYQNGGAWGLVWIAPGVNDV